MNALKNGMMLSGIPPAISDLQSHSDLHLTTFEDTGVSQKQIVSWELVFVDAEIEDYSILLDGVVSTSSDVSAEEVRFRDFFLLDSRGDGVQQMTDVISFLFRMCPPFTSCHTRSGIPKLSGKTLDRFNLESFGPQLSSRRNSSWQTQIFCLRLQRS